MADLCGQDNMVRVRYLGPIGTHLVPSPYKKVGTYGMHTYGDVFCVHFDDQKAAPNLFMIEPEASPPAPEPAPAATTGPEAPEESESELRIKRKAKKE